MFFEPGAVADLPVGVQPVAGLTRLAACPLPLAWLTLPKQSRFTLWFGAEEIGIKIETIRQSQPTALPKGGGRCGC
jgi:hypothetical protein